MMNNYRTAVIEVEGVLLKLIETSHSEEEI
jgi:hypothetical protein